MGTRIGKLPGGVLVPGRCTSATLEARDGTATGSSYTESTPRPGLGAVADAGNKSRIEISNGQGEDIELRCIRAGMPGRDGAAFAYRLGGESATTDWRGWNPPVWLEAWRPVDWSSSVKYNKADICTIRESQICVVARVASDTGACASRTISPDTLSIGAVSSASMPAGAAWNFPAICAIQGTTRILCMFGGVVYYTDDQGGTWARYSAHPIAESVVTYGRSRMSYYRGQLLLLVEDTTTAGKVYQYASSDLGTTFSLVDTLTGWGDWCSILSTGAGLFVIRRKAATYYPNCVRLASPFEPLSRADANEIEFATRFTSGSLAEIVSWADPDGALWCVVKEAADRLYLYQSLDDGQTWDEHHGAMWESTTTSDTPRLLCAASAAGRCVMPHYYSADVAGYDDALSVSVWGGYSNVTVGPPSGVSAAGGYIYRLGSGGYQATIPALDVTGGIWVPYELPSDGFGWTSTGVGAKTLTASGEMNILTPAGGLTNDQYSRFLDAALCAHVLMFEVRVNDGGATGFAQIGVFGVVADGTDEYTYTIGLTTTGYGVDDAVASTSLATVSIDLTDWLQFLVYCDEAGTLSVWHRRPGQTKWTPSVSAHSLTSDTVSPASQSEIRWGHVALTVTDRDSDWRFLTYQAFDNTAQPRLYTGGANVYGRSMSSQETPIPDAIDPDDRAPFLAMVDGPARMGDTISIEAEHDYPIDAVFPELSPSPSAKWRSTDTTEQVIAFDLEARSWAGDAVGLYITGANFRTAVLEYYDGAAWVSAGTLDMATGFAALGMSYDLVGDTVVPRSGTATGGRFLLHQELVGGHVILAASDVREITAQSAGSWTDATTVQPRIRITGLDGTEAANGSIVIVSPRGLLLTYLASVQIRRRWRVRIPAQTTPHGYFSAGAIVVGRVQPWGARVDWSRSDEWTPNVETSRTSYGTLRTRQVGPVARTWAVSWNDAAHGRYLRSGSDIDWHGVSGGLPLTAQDDIGYLLGGLLAETKGGEIPVVIVEELPSASGTLTDPSRMLYGRMSTPARINAVQGDLGVDEIYRVEGVTVSELV